MRLYRAWSLFAMCSLGTSFCSGVPFGFQPAESCNAVIRAAVAKARKDHKRVFVEFGSSWCKPCRALENLLRSDGMWPVIGMHFEIVSISHHEDNAHKNLENAGAAAWAKKAGVVAAFPSYCILDQNGAVVRSSTHPSSRKKFNELGGPPFSYGEMEGFLRMLSEGCPDITQKELIRVRKALEDNVAQHGASRLAPSSIEKN